jgi:two-component system NtrC family response regulator
LALPPLRGRLADIVPLAEHFLAISAVGGTPKRLTAEAAARLLAYDWPGNVRELRNAVERVSALVRRPFVTAVDLGFLSARAAPLDTDWFAGTLPEAFARLEMEMISRALAASRGNRAQAAKRLGIRRQLLYEKIARYGLDTSAKRTTGVPDGDINR